MKTPPTIDMLPIVREDGTREFVQATPDLVTPPAKRVRKPKPTSIFDYLEFNPFVFESRRDGIGYYSVGVDFAESFDGAAALERGRAIAGKK